MKKQGMNWAEKVIAKFERGMCKGMIHPYSAAHIVKLEHARAVRIVLRLMKQAEKEHRLNQYNAMAEVLTALQRGRGGKG